MSLRSEFAISPFGENVGVGGPPLEPGNLPVLTPEEIRNGWTPEKLARYRQERDRAAYNTLFAPAKQRPQRTASKHDPHKW